MARSERKSEGPARGTRRFEEFELEWECFERGRVVGSDAMVMLALEELELAALGCASVVMVDVQWPVASLSTRLMFKAASKTWLYCTKLSVGRDANDCRR